MAIEIIRLLNVSAAKEQIKHIELFVSSEVADYLQNEKRVAISHFEQLNNKRITIRSSSKYTGEKHEMFCYNERGIVVKL